MRFKAPPPHPAVPRRIAELGAPRGTCMGASGVPCTATNTGAVPSMIYVDDFVSLQHNDEETSSDSGASSSHCWSSDPMANRFWHNNVFCMAAWVTQALRNGVSLVSVPLGFATVEDLAALLPATDFSTAFQEKRLALLDAALLCPELLQVKDAGRHLAIRAISGHCAAISATLDTGSLPVMLTCHAPELLAYTCNTRAQQRIWRSGWCAEADSEDGRYIWFHPLEPLQRWMGGAWIPEKAEVPAVIYFLCNEAVHSGVKVLSYG